MSFMDKLKEIDMEHIEPTYSVHREDQYSREDSMQQSLPIYKTLENVPDHRKGPIRILKMIKGRDK